MEIKIIRAWRKDGYTIGKVFVDGERWCESLEDTDRGLHQRMSNAEIAKRKIKGKTAIPTGTYNVEITYSPRFKKMLPLVVDVPGFSGIRIHSGNTAEDTDGCILLGRNTAKGRVNDSRYWTNKLLIAMETRAQKGERVSLFIGY